MFCARLSMLKDLLDGRVFVIELVVMFSRCQIAALLLSATITCIAT
jgi:hypothetical protein